MEFVMNQEHANARIITTKRQIVLNLHVTTMQTAMVMASASTLSAIASLVGMQRKIATHFCVQKRLIAIYMGVVKMDNVIV